MMDVPGASLTRHGLLICALLGGTVVLPAAPARAPAAEAAPQLVEAFQKGPITLTAQVTEVGLMALAQFRAMEQAAGSAIADRVAAFQDLLAD